jgi:hypothetical protein
MGSASGDVPIQTFIDTLSPIAIENLPQWCNLCGNNFSRGCQYLQEGNVNADTKGLRWGGSVSPVGAGFLGAGLTVFVVVILMMVGIALGVLRVGKARPVRRGSKASSGELELVVCASKLRRLTYATDSPVFPGDVRRIPDDVRRRVGPCRNVPVALPTTGSGPLN